MWWEEWSAKLDTLSSTHYWVFMAVPVLELLLICVWLRVVWPMKHPPSSQDAPDPGDLIAGIERFFRKDDSVVAAKTFSVDGSTIPKGTYGFVHQDNSNNRLLKDRAVKIVFDVDEGRPVDVEVPKSKFSKLEIEKEKKMDSLRPPASETEPLDPASKYASQKVMDAGDTGGYYDAPWTETFDLHFIYIMVAFVALLAGLSYLFPMADDMQAFLVNQLPKVGIMMLVSFLGGLLARWYLQVDDRGYVTSASGKGTWFKVNYTRKIQHFAAYMIPLVVSNKGVAADPSPLGKMLVTAWADWFTLLGFLVLITPIREAPSFIGTFFMLQFNSLDRPEDRPNTLDWIILGNILPGLACILFFNWLYSLTGYSIGLTMIFVLVAGVGDGLAEPVGVSLGRHKYRTAGCQLGSSDGKEPKKFTRTLEGSACVWWSTLVFVAMYVQSFPNMTAYWIAAVVMPPLMTVGEAYAPHTMDTPVLMGLGGFALLGIAMACDNPTVESWLG